MRQCRVYRGILYVAGLLILALGLTLNTKTGLGTSPINGCENYSFAYRDYSDRNRSGNHSGDAWRGPGNCCI